MSYNTRHSRGGVQQKYNPPSANFVSAGSMASGQQAAQQTQHSTPLKSIMKQPKSEPVTPVSTPAPPQDPVVNTDTANNAGKKPWQKGPKLSKKEKRERRNKRIGKLVKPKNALMVLNELCGGNNLKFEETGLLNGRYGVVVIVNGQSFEGYGPSKHAAKQNAAEIALRNYISGKLKKHVTTTMNNEEESNEMDTDDVEDVSWCQLASFALFKLMDSWQGEGDFIPPEAPVKQPPKQVNLKPAKQLPDNAAALHPLMLLHQMRPGIVIQELEVQGQLPNVTYVVEVEIDGQRVIGKGPNKKAAKKNCAQTVMEKFYGVVYPSDNAMITN